MSETAYLSPNATLVTDTISTGNIAIQNDLLKNWLYLTPSPANENAILAGFTRFANTYANYLGSLFWANPSRYQSISASSGLAAGNYGWTGGVVIPDGRAVYAPWNALYIGVYNPRTLTWTTYAHGWGNTGIEGAFLLPDGRVGFCPFGSATPFIGFFNPITNTTTSVNITWTNGLSQGAVVVSNTLVVLAPSGSVTQIGLFNPTTNTLTTLASSPPPNSSSYHYTSPVLLPNGNIVFPPNGNDFIGVFNPTTQAFTTCSGNGWLTVNGGNFNGGVLLPDGRVFLSNTNRNFIGLYNYKTNSFTTLVTGYTGYRGSVLMPNGIVLQVPAASGTTNIGIFNSFTNSYTTISGASANHINGLITPFGQALFSPFGPPGATQQLGIITGIPPVPIEYCIHPFFNKY